jgi:hypothetical protein
MSHDLERAEREATVDVIRAAPKPLAEALGVTLSTAPGRACWAVKAMSGDRVFNRAMGLGRDRSTIAADLDDAARFYAEAGVRYTVSVSPGAAAGELAEQLLARGFTADYAWMKFRRGVEPPAATETSLRIERIGRGHAAAFGRVVTAAFELPLAFERWTAALVGRPGWQCFVGFDADVPAAAGALYVAGESGWLGFGATAPEFRRRGGQSAIFAARLVAAREAGCSFVVTETGEQVEGRPSKSYRNILRAGFEEAYLRPNYLSPA